MTIQLLFEGKNIRLTALTDVDLPLITQWSQDSQFQRFLSALPAFPHEQSRHEQWLAEHRKESNSYLFAIRLLDENQLIGWLELDDILWAHGTGWISIAIGDPNQRGHGYGHEAMALLLDFAFGELNLHRVQLTVFAYNTAAIRLYERLGFTREGIYREFLQRDGQRHDMILFGLLVHEWKTVSAESTSE